MNQATEVASLIEKAATAQVKTCSAATRYADSCDAGLLEAANDPREPLSQRKVRCTSGPANTNPKGLSERALAVTTVVHSPGIERPLPSEAEHSRCRANVN